MIEVPRGDNVVRDLTVTQPGGVLPFSLFGSVLWFTVKRNTRDADPGIIQHQSGGVSPAIVVTDENGGLAVHTIAPSETEDLEVGYRYVYDYRLVDSIGDPYTIETGIFMVTPNSTRDFGV